MRSPRLLLSLLSGLLLAAARAEEVPEKNLSAFLESYCLDCHDAETRKGNLDLTALGHEATDAKAFAAWVKIHDRVRAGEMPPRKDPAGAGGRSRLFEDGRHPAHRGGSHP